LTLIDSSDSYLTISPISNKRFIKNENKEIFVIINNREITLINHVYGYNLMMEDENMYQNIIQKFDLTLEQKRQKFENEMRDNVRHSLKTILEKIS
jgi:hypothetical protein